MFLLSDIITYVRRIIKSPSNAVITDDLLIDYINRFWITDVDARMQLFDLKTKYQFQTQPGVDKYNMPLYSVQTEPGSQVIGMYPVYQGFLSPAYVNGIQISFETQKNLFYNLWPNIIQQSRIIGTGNGTNGPYTLCLPVLPHHPFPHNPPLNAIVRGHIDMTGIIAYGNATNLNQDPPRVTSFETIIPVTSVDSCFFLTSRDATYTNVIVQDSGQFLINNVNSGLLMAPGPAPFGNTALPGGYLTQFPITGITQATQAVITSTTTYQIGQRVEISGVNGMTQLNGNHYSVVASTGTTVTLDVDSSSFTAYTSGGTISSIQNIINYVTGIAENVYFPADIPVGEHIFAEYIFFQSGLPRAALFYNNTLTLRSVPAFSYLVELDCYLSPCAFLNTAGAIPFGYMAEYIARGAAQKLLSDVGDWEQYDRYEPIFRTQELLVWKRSQRQWTATRTQTIYSQGNNNGQIGFNNGININ